MTCGMNWANNINDCQHGMTNKERDLLELVFPNQAWQYRLERGGQNQNIPTGGLYYCTNCPNVYQNNFWYL